MKLTGELKKRVETTQTPEEARKIIRDTIEDAGLLLDDEDLDKVSGGLRCQDSIYHEGVDE